MPNEWDEKRMDTIAQNGNDGDHYSTLKQRGQNYGLFVAQASLSQQLAEVMRGHINWSTLAPDQKEALEMVQHKIARIINGNPNYTDSWHDIAGYVSLVERRLNGEII